MTRSLSQKQRPLQVLLVFGLLLVLGLSANRANAQDVSLDLAFVTHLDMEMPEQDVYIERERGTGKVYRVTPGDHNMSATLRSTRPP